MESGWRRRTVGVGAIAALASAGCFSESPTVDPMAQDETDGADSTGGTGNASADESGDASSTAAEETAGEDDGAECVLVKPAIPRLDADVVVGVDPSTEVSREAGLALEGGLLGWDGDPHLVVLAGPGLDIESDCPGAVCGDECESANVLYVVEDGELANPLDLFVPADRYECALRLEDAGPSGVHTNFIHITDRPEAVSLGAAHLDLFESTDAVYNVACPGCSPDEQNPATLIAQESFGSVVDLDDPEAVAELAFLAGSQRLECVWPVDAPDGYEGEDLSIYIDIDQVAGGGSFALERVENEGDCGFDPGFETLQWYLDPSSDNVVLCLDACLFARVAPAVVLDVQHEFCR